jgi:hypothetical protein
MRLTNAYDLVVIASLPNNLRIVLRSGINWRSSFSSSALVNGGGSGSGGGSLARFVILSIATLPLPES